MSWPKVIIYSPLSPPPLLLALIGFLLLPVGLLADALVILRLVSNVDHFEVLIGGG